MNRPPCALPVPADDVVYSRVPDGAVLLSTEQEVYYGLNEVGARVWELLPESDDLDDLCGELHEEYPDGGAERIRRDVRELLGDLREHGLVGSLDFQTDPPAADVS